MISHLEISHLRNINHTSIQLSEGINIFYGDNGSGKSSILEAIYILGRGRSFRGASPAPRSRTGARNCGIAHRSARSITLRGSDMVRGCVALRCGWRGSCWAACGPSCARVTPPTPDFKRPWPAPFLQRCAMLPWRAARLRAKAQRKV